MRNYECGIMNAELEMRKSKCGIKTGIVFGLWESTFATDEITAIIFN